MKLRYTKRAVRQIEDIIDTIATEYPQGARRVRERMQSITMLLIEHPHIGQQTDLDGVRRRRGDCRKPGNCCLPHPLRTA